MSRPRLSEEERGELRRLISLRDGSGDRCFYCRRKFRKRPMRRKTFDHYIPYSLWQTWELHNLVLACESCNVRKDNVLPWPVALLLLRNIQQYADVYEEAA